MHLRNALQWKMSFGKIFILVAQHILASDHRMALQSSFVNATSVAIHSSSEFKSALQLLAPFSNEELRQRKLNGYSSTVSGAKQPPTSQNIK